jgi:hypothetical protein
MKIRLVVALVASRFASPILAQQTDKIDQQMAHQRRLNIPGLLPVKVGDGTTRAQFRVVNPAAFADFSTRDRQQPRWPFSPQQRAGDRDVSQDLTCNNTLEEKAATAQVYSGTSCRGTRKGICVCQFATEIETTHKSERLTQRD